MHDAIIQSTNALDALYAKVASVIPPAEWALFAPDIAAIHRLKIEKNAIILAHNYMTPEIFHGVADVVGDSLLLARRAAESDAAIIVVAGVHFMAETAKLLNPARKVLIPDPKAGCSLAESITPDDMRALRQKYPGVPIVTYVNTSAAVKAEADICCTSGNARKIVESLGAARVILAPDGYLARNVGAETKVEVIPWEGRCEVHERFTAQDIQAYREGKPALRVLAHPECAPDVVGAADFAGSTARMIEWIASEKPAQAMLITECSMSDNVAVQFPETSFIRPCHLCPHMKRITLKNIRAVLENEAPEVVISPDIAERARLSVTRMLEASV